MIPQPGNIIYCKYCNLNKDIEDFTSSSLKKPSPKCKLCVKAYNDSRKEISKKYREDNKEKLTNQKKAYYKENKEYLKSKTKKYAANNQDKISEYQTKYYKENKNELLEYQEEYYKNNSEYIINRTGTYYKNNKQDILKRHKGYIRDRRRIDPIFKIRGRISNTIGKLLKSIGFSKNDNSILKYLPYSIEELKNHLEEQFEYWMTWANHGKYDPKTWVDDNSSTWTWNIDHIIPQSKLPYTSMTDDNFIKCWSLDNLRPYSSKQNIIDGSRR